MNPVQQLQHKAFLKRKEAEAQTRKDFNERMHKKGAGVQYKKHSLPNFPRGKARAVGAGVGGALALGGLGYLIHRSIKKRRQNKK